MSPSNAASSGDSPGQGGGMVTQSEDEDQTMPQALNGTVPEKDKVAEPAVALNKDAAKPSWSEQDRHQAAHDEPVTSVYAPVNGGPSYGGGSSAGPAYASSPPYVSSGYQAPQPPPAAVPSTVNPVSRSHAAARRARLKVSHMGPLSVLRVALTFALCMFIVLLVAVAALWGVLDSSGVFKSIIRAATTLTNDNRQPGIVPWLSFGRVMLITVVLGAANVIAFTLLSTIGALLYNLCSDFVGGVEVTLVER